MKTIQEINGKKVEISYDKRVELSPIKVYVSDSMKEYNTKRMPPIGFKQYRILN